MSAPRNPIQRAALGAASRIKDTLPRAQETQWVQKQADQLADAVFADDTAKVAQLLAEGTPPDLPIPGETFTPLMLAAGRDALDVAELLLAAGADPNHLAAGRGTPLTFALSSSTQKVVARLLEAGADPNRVPEGAPPTLHFAVDAGHAEGLHRVLEAGAEVDARDSEGYSALRVAMDQDHMDLALILVQRGAHSEIPEPDGWSPLLAALQCMDEALALAMLGQEGLNLEALRTPEGNCALDVAVAGGMKPVMERLLDLGHPVDGYPGARGTPLLRAMLYGQPELVQLLLGRGARVGELPEELDESTPNLLLVAAYFGFLEVLEAGATRGVDFSDVRILEAAGSGGRVPVLEFLQRQGIALGPDSAYGRKVLEATAHRARSEALAWMLAQGWAQAELLEASPKLVDIALLQEMTPPKTSNRNEEDRAEPAQILECVRALVGAGCALVPLSEEEHTFRQMGLLSFGRLEVLQGLVDQGLVLASPGAGLDLLHLATHRGPEFVRFVLDRGFDPNAVGEPEGVTPVWLAASVGQAESLALLLEAGGNPNWVEEAGWTPLHVACEEGHRDVVERLLAQGAKPNVQDHEGWTPLMVAVRGGHLGLVQLLLKRGARRDLRNREQGTALTLARKLHRKDLMRLLG